ncbi:MAG: glycosyltransferase family 2 protein [Planctomycetota bacterium]|jgi:glycosyltransferase involved in cell wall biosynthesis
MTAMPSSFRDLRVSIALVLSDRLPYDRAAFGRCLEAALSQDHPSVEVIVVDDRGPRAAPDFVPPAFAGGHAIRHLPGRYRNRAATYNAAIEAASGAFFLAVFNDQAPVVLRRSAVQTMVMAAARHEPVGMVYADYEVIDSAGCGKEIHLLDWHEGRLRDSTDFGRAILYSTDALRELGAAFNEKYTAADVYDLRLRIAEKYRPVHVASRFAGALYTVAAPPQGHNVFEYLLAEREAQREMEEALTEHLRRTGAYLAPGRNVRRVEYEADQERGFADCIASVVIPVNNRPEFIGQAIESVRRQTVPNVEVIVVVNGGDQDPTAEAVRRYMSGGDCHDPQAPQIRLIVLDVNNIGLCLNTGIAAARGKYYVQLDSDDRLQPDAVEKLLEVFDSDPTVGMVIGSYEVWQLDEKTSQVVRHDEIPVVTHDEWTVDNGRNNLLRINGAGAPRAAHIKVIREVGWFGVNDDPSCRNYGEDYDLVLRISERYAIGRVWEPIYEVIRHSGGTDHSIDQATIARNDEAKDRMRLEALRRRRLINQAAGG